MSPQSERRATAAALVALMVVAVLLQVPLWNWEVEDSAITFAYANNLAHGDGLVPQPGAERVEGFSNPSWLAIMAVIALFGGNLFDASRVLGLVAGVGCVPVVWWAVRPLGNGAALAAATIVACSAGHVIWAQSGLENALFALLVAAALARTATGGDRDLAAPLLWFGVASTRPDGLAWAAVGCLFGLARARSLPAFGLRLALWSVGLLAPLLAVEAARIAYFAQELPATFHAKVGQASVDWLAWRGRGWMQVRQVGTITLGALPLLVFGAVGVAGWRGVVALVTVSLAGLALVVPGVPERMLSAGGLVLLGLLVVCSIGRPTVVGLAAWLFAVGCAFQIGAGGDWMRGARFLSLVVVPAAVLVGVGLASVASLLPRLGPSLAVVTLLLYGAAQGRVLAGYDRNPEATPGSAFSRLRHWLEVARKIGLERRPLIVDHDMGGFLYYGGDDAWIRDARGLVDLPFALHGRTPAFVRDELFGHDRTPFDFAHRHASTGAALARLFPEMQGYIEIPGYGRKLPAHGGQWIRRDHVLVLAWPRPTEPARFAGGVAIDGVHVPSPEVGAGSALFFELGLTRDPRTPFRMVAFLAQGDVLGASYDVAPAYDWLPVPRWRPGEHFHGRFAVRIPEGLPEGTWDLGFAVFDRDGTVLPFVDGAPSLVVPTVPAFAHGEVRYPGRVSVVSREEMVEAAEVDLAASAADAAAGRCVEAEESWELAVRHRARSLDWKDAHRPATAAVLARCWATRASAGSISGDELLLRVKEVERGRGWDPREPAVWDLARAIADEAHRRAVAATTDDERFRWHDAAVRADPRRSWDRRAAEQARTRILGPAPAQVWGQEAEVKE